MKSGVSISEVGVGVCASMTLNFSVLDMSSTKEKHFNNSSYNYSSVWNEILTEKHESYLTNNAKETWLIDANSTALVTPRVTPRAACECRKAKTSLEIKSPAVKLDANTQGSKLNSQPVYHRDVNIDDVFSTCQPNPCLNGGLCRVSAQTGPR